ncbi:sulfur carrier protein ThiS [Photorhabdus laumondii subsp. laumondii]|uniref:ThiS protein n=2 Tax=Photorhabdus laumondii subsp. laumondii TaxID=141679 RepID=Q7N965_PHOLL|nr:MULTISPECIES: sulfur carrier protein ThiS [Photorhabdus]AWK40447.1 thiamine biosynthesis protein ThiS [Photorhabdus laumondii subsp. laumondii]AXG41255.1 sulfur carrier protein ThiS [Photorhabdus laumondii subsp. laumondii]AXG45786.1 sulfur carrier protein ThiS [Photorhabdus laumondii subsp. laumondii]KTL63281.1 thiamine biosynthesis protein ThiS [Photorhabdus laumondii subsp. laumondii]MCC8386206.1 sulfur carrier protein ThiS [Photorhabdus laumondii]
MKITVNDQPMELMASLAIQQLLEQLEQTQPGMALAINQTIIPRSEWNTHRINDGDNILLFQAIAGG